jgi:two-component system cell cycle response regulator
MRPTPVRILVIDDDREDIELIDRVLLDHGYVPLLATSGQEAMQIAAMQEPELVLLDIRMPRMDGYEIARRLRRAPGLARALIVAVTGSADERERIDAAGFDGVMSKPIEPDSFLAQIEALLNAPR